jgi:hypothetical protein
MIFDTTNLFWHTGSAFAFTSGEFTSLVGTTESGAGSPTIALTNPRDMGIGDGVAIPKIACIIGTAVTTGNTTATCYLRFQGSTDSTNWTTYAQTDALTTASLTAGSMPLMIDIPPVPTGVSLPSYYRLFFDVDNTGGTQSISAGTILAGIVLSRDNNNVGQYASGFSVI